MLRSLIVPMVNAARAESSTGCIQQVLGLALARMITAIPAFAAVTAEPRSVSLSGQGRQMRHTRQAGVGMGVCVGKSIPPSTWSGFRARYQGPLRFFGRSGGDFGLSPGHRGGIAGRRLHEW